MLIICARSFSHHFTILSGFGGGHPAVSRTLTQQLLSTHANTLWPRETLSQKYSKGQEIGFIRSSL